MTVRLRAHHLLCLLTYVGRGYSSAFVATMDEVAARLANGEEVLIVAGPDEICAPLLRDEVEPHCLGENALDRDQRAAADVAELLGRPVAPSSRLKLERANLTRLRDAFGSGSVRAACAGCEWAALCTAIAETGFGGARLSCPPAATPAAPITELVSIP